MHKSETIRIEGLLNNRIFLSDTYPDKYSDRSLFLFDMDKKRKNILGNYYSNIKCNHVLSSSEY